MRELMSQAMAPTGSPDWWFHQLRAKFTAVLSSDRTREGRWTTRDTRLQSLWSYYRGDPPMPQVAEEFRETFREIMREARANYAGMAVTALADRISVSGVATLADDDADGDDTVGRIMENSTFAAEFKDMLSLVFAMSEAYLLVLPPAPGSASLPIIRAADPRICVGIENPQVPHQLRGLLLMHRDELTGDEAADLYLPGVRYRIPFIDGRWMIDDPVAMHGIEAFGGIPAVRFDNRDRAGEFEPHLDLLDRINGTTLKRLVLTEYQAFRQRAVKGDLNGDDEDYEGEGGEQVDLNEIFKADPGALWFVPAGVDFWESNQADLTPIISAKRDDVKEFAAVTGTPLHLITPDAANGSAEGASLMRETLTHKIADRKARLLPRLKLVFALALTVAGKPQSPDGMRVMWGSGEQFTLAEAADAAAKLRDLVADQQLLMWLFGMSPAEVKANDKALTRQQLTRAVATAQAPSAITGRQATT